jgi:hypothetical protein
MLHADLAARLPAIVSGRFRADEPVFAHHPDGVRFGAPVWDLTPLVRRVSLPDRTIDFTTIPDGWELTVREVLMVAAQPDHPAVVDAGVVRRGRPAPLATMMAIFRHLRTIARWATSRGLAAPPHWCQADADALLADLRTGAHRAAGAALSPSSISGHVTALKLLREFAPVLTEHGLPFQPWGARSPSNVAGLVVDAENRTPPLRWDTWAPAVAAAWAFVDRFSTDIAAAAKARAALPPHDHGTAGAAAFDILRSWADGGGKVPLHTGYGRYRSVCGEPNVTMLCRRLGITRSIFNRDHACYRPQAEVLLAEMAADPGRREYGGLWTPRVTVRHADGTDRPWIDELGLAELELLVSILRGAAYTLLASLTGMRDSELQQLTRDTAIVADGLPALQGLQFKGAATPDGRARSWFGPPPVFRAIDVLAAVSPHPRYLFARSATNAGSYCPQQDIARLIAFVNTNPQHRHGRGHGLGLQPIQPTPTANVNQITLRRSFSVYAAQYPGAELGLGIQLGHAALRAVSNRSPGCSTGTGRSSPGNRSARSSSTLRRPPAHRPASSTRSAPRSSPTPTGPHGSSTASPSGTTLDSSTTACGTNPAPPADPAARNSPKESAAAPAAATPSSGRRTCPRCWPMSDASTTSSTPAAATPRYAMTCAPSAPSTPASSPTSTPASRRKASDGQPGPQTGHRRGHATHQRRHRPAQHRLGRPAHQTRT